MSADIPPDLSAMNKAFFKATGQEREAERRRAQDAKVRDSDPANVLLSPYVQEIQREEVEKTKP